MSFINTLKIYILKVPTNLNAKIYHNDKIYHIIRKKVKATQLLI